MNSEQPTYRVEFRCFSAPPVPRIERAAGVSAVEIDGPTVRCLVAGSFQPLLEALRGHEVITLRSTPAVEATASTSVSSTRVEGDL
jgi:hypothetical protein